MNIHSESLERAKLRTFENEGKWVFHGSGSKIEILEPRQAYNYPTDSDEEKIPDGKPAVFASPSVDIAIFMAILNKENAPKGARSGFDINDNGTFQFRTTQATIDQINNAVGYVYVFDATKFAPISAGESVSYKAVIPDEVVVVSEKDLPINIDIKDF